MAQSLKKRLQTPVARIGTDAFKQVKNNALVSFKHLHEIPSFVE